MDTKDKIMLVSIAFFVDVCLIYSIINLDLSYTDYLWNTIVLISHSIFYYAIRIYNKNLIDKLHYLVFILPLFSIFLDSVFLKTVVLIHMSIIQILWIKENRCIMNEKDDVKFGYGNELSIATLIFNLFLAFNIGYSIK